MKPGSDAAQQITLALAREYCDTVAFSATPISPAAAVSSKRKPVSHGAFRGAVLGLIQDLFKFVCSINVHLAGKVSIVFTPCGPLVYQWKNVSLSY